MSFVDMGKTLMESSDTLTEWEKRGIYKRNELVVVRSSALPMGNRQGTLKDKYTGGTKLGSDR